jgi:hypothetical protein
MKLLDLLPLGRLLANMVQLVLHNRKKMRAKLNVLKFILVQYSRPL